jgi:hypothetical protein
MFCEFMLYSIIGNLYGSRIVTEKWHGGITRNTKISQQSSKPYNLCSSSGKCSKFYLYTRTRYNYLLLRLPCNRRAKKDAIACDRTTVHWVTHPSGVRVLSMQDPQGSSSIRGLAVGPSLAHMPDKRSEAIVTSTPSRIGRTSRFPNRKYLLWLDQDIFFGIRLGL